MERTFCNFDRKAKAWWAVIGIVWLLNTCLPATPGIARGAGLCILLPLAVGFIARYLRLYEQSDPADPSTATDPQESAQTIRALALGAGTFIGVLTLSLATLLGPDMFPTPLNIAVWLLTLVVGGCAASGIILTLTELDNGPITKINPVTKAAAYGLAALMFFRIMGSISIGDFQWLAFWSWILIFTYVLVEFVKKDNQERPLAGFLAVSVGIALTSGLLISSLSGPSGPIGTPGATSPSPAHTEPSPVSTADQGLVDDGRDDNLLTARNLNPEGGLQTPKDIEAQTIPVLQGLDSVPTNSADRSVYGTGLRTWRNVAEQTIHGTSVGSIPDYVSCLEATLEGFDYSQVVPKLYNRRGTRLILAVNAPRSTVPELKDKAIEYFGLDAKGLQIKRVSAVRTAIGAAGKNGCRVIFDERSQLLMVLTAPGLTAGVAQNGNPVYWGKSS